MRGRAASFVLAAGLVALGLALSLVLEPAQLSGGAPSTTTATEPQPTGLISVAVRVQSFDGSFVPGEGVNVGITSSSFPEVRASVQTNQSGVALFPASPGEYEVAVNDRRFSVASNVRVVASMTTRLAVTVNRTEYSVEFADVQVLGSTDVAETWGTMTLAVSGPLPGGGAGGGALPQAVFLDAFTCCILFPGPPQSKEVAASVVSQASRGGLYFVEVRPAEELNLTGSQGLLVATYNPGTRVSMAVGYVG